jgi:hypothetical protein
MNDELTDYEKLIEAISNLADTVHTYYERLIENGFSPEQALSLCIQYQKDIMTMAKGK